MSRFIYGLLLPSIFVVTLTAQQLAFPGAEGAGRFAWGGRGGQVIEVTNLNDSGPGSLREALGTPGKRTVVFRVAGTIRLESQLSITQDSVTVAGQTAPGEGITLRGYTLRVMANEVVIRYIRSRVGAESGKSVDAMSGKNIHNVIIDHCTASWSVDEVASFYDNTNFTMQWCIISEALHNSVHYKERAHGFGGIWGGENVSFHHNLLAHNNSRNPRMSRSMGPVDHRNNVIYNWHGNSSYGGEGGQFNLVNNFYKPGPATKTKDRVIEPLYSLPDGGWGTFYVNGNYIVGAEAVNQDNWNGGVQNAKQSDVRAYEAYPFAPVTTHAPEVAYELVLADAGASAVRDTIDRRIVRETRDGIATFGGSYVGPERGILDSPEDCEGWPDLETGEAVQDNDHDGMADGWEIINGFDAEDGSDHKLDADGDGYSNLEEYLHELCIRDDYLAAPGNLILKTLDSSSIHVRWAEAVSDETGFRIERAISKDGPFESVGKASANDSVFTDSGLEAETLYYYRVFAVRDELESIPTATQSVEIGSN
ncbi:MAG: pectate lyase [Candidatus Marinimicrobia bacterium]|jgi:pectate lyase|nr:pectate lyase [Candidatus Neomarinimicrobiota bacterium]